MVGMMPIVQRPLAAVIARGRWAGAPPARPGGPHGRGHRAALRRSGRRLRGERRRRRAGAGRAGDDRLQRRLLAGRRQGGRGDRLLERRGGRAAAPGHPDPRSSRSTTTARRPIRSWSWPPPQRRSNAIRSWSTPSSPPPNGATSSLSTTRAAPWTICSPRYPPRPRRTGRPARARCGPTSAPRRSTPRSCANGRHGTSSTACCSARSTSSESLQAGPSLRARAVAQQQLGGRQFADHPRARHRQVDPGRLGGPAGLDVDVGVVAEHRDPEPDQRLGVLGLEVGDQQLGFLAAAPRPATQRASPRGPPRSGSPRPCCRAAGRRRGRRRGPSGDH